MVKYSIIEVGANRVNAIFLDALFNQKEAHLKQLLVLSVILVSFAVLASDFIKSPEITQVVVEIPNLSSVSTQNNLETEFTNLRGINSCDITELNGTITLRYDDTKVNKQIIDRILLKWGCTPTNYTFNKFIK